MQTSPGLDVLFRIYGIIVREITGFQLCDVYNVIYIAHNCDNPIQPFFHAGVDSLSHDGLKY